MNLQTHESTGRTLKALGMVLLALALTASAGWAHTDPPGANTTATAQSLGVFSDNLCTIPLTVIVASSGERQLVLRAGQSAYVQATLNFSGAPGAASYEGGRWRMLASGVVFGPDPLTPVPCIGNTLTSVDDPGLPGGRGLCAGTPGMLVSPCVQYITTAADDAAGFINFQAILGDPNPFSPDTSFAHLGVNDLAGVSSSVPQTVLIQRCGDGNLDGGEDCDDGNNTDGDGCRADCTIEMCGDGILDPPAEACDDGNNVSGDGCSAMCMLESCGDGVVTPPETCDDGNNVSGDGCSAMCMVESCGDGVVTPPETCDDGNNVDGDGCSATCVVEMPTMGEWGAILLALVLLVLGALGAQASGRRRTV